jgi:hypothetical protein
MPIDEDRAEKRAAQSRKAVGMRQDRRVQP